MSLPAKQWVYGLSNKWEFNAGMETGELPLELVRKQCLDIWPKEYTSCYVLGQKSLAEISLSLMAQSLQIQPAQIKGKVVGDLPRDDANREFCRLQNQRVAS